MTEKVKDEKEHTFTTQTGLTLHLRPVPRMLIRDAITAVAGAIKIPPRPFYTVETDGGGNELHYHDNKSIAGKRFTTEEQQAYLDWLAADLTLEAAQNEIAAKTILTQGVVEDPPEGWDGVGKSLGLPLTDDPVEIKWRWLTHVVLISMIELNELQEKIMQPVREYEKKYAEARAAARAAFQSTEGEKERPDPGQSAGAD